MNKRNSAALGGYAVTAVVTLLTARTLAGKGIPSSVTRKIVHVVAGLSPLYVTWIARDKWAGVLPFVATTAVNGALWSQGTPSFMAEGKDTPGIVYFSLSQGVLLWWLWHPNRPGDRLPLARAALMSLALGDAAAALVGKARGRHGYIVLGNYRSIEGSAAMAIVTFLVVIASLWQYRPVSEAARLAAGAAIGGTLVEAISPAGLDNLTVPAAIAIGLAIATGTNGSGEESSSENLPFSA